MVIGTSFRDALALLADAHEHEMPDQRGISETQLMDLRREIDLLYSRTGDANRLGVDLSSDPARGSRAVETVAEQRPVGVDTFSVSKDQASLCLDPRTSPGANLNEPPPSASSSALFGELPLKCPGTSPTGPDPSGTNPAPQAGAGNRPCGGPRWLWEVVGGKDTGGIPVWESESTNSPQMAAQLSTCALVEEIKLADGRLHFKLFAGSGPEKGWTSTTVQGKDLVVRAGLAPLKLRQPPPVAVGPDNEEPLPIAIVFVGGHMPTGSLDAFMDLPAVRKMLDNARPILGIDSSMEAMGQVLASTSAGVFMSELIALESVKAQQPEVVRRAAAMAWMGVGTWAALCASGALSFEDGLRLVRTISKAEAACAGKQRSISVKGLAHDKLQLLCLQACAKEGRGAVCEISFYFAPDRHVVGGTAGAVDAVWKRATTAGAQVSGLSHTAHHASLMMPAQTKCRAGLYKALPNMRPPLHTVWMGTTAEPARPGCDPVDIIGHLEGFNSRPELRYQFEAAMRGEGISEFYNVIKGLSHSAPILTPSNTVELK